MHFLRDVYRSKLSWALSLLIVLAGAAAAQTGAVDYSKPQPSLPNPFLSYSGRNVAAPSFANSARIDQLVKNGRLMLSLNDAIALALENNLDLVIARYNLPIADTDVLRTKSGNSFRGVNTGIVAGTPGGGGITTSGATGAGAGGTTIAAGGAGAGAAGLVSSTLGVGPLVGSFDPSLTGTLQIDRLAQPQASVFTGVPSLLQNTGTANFTYNQYFATGTTMQVGFNNSRITSNNEFNELNPILNSSFRMTVTQHLLSGFGLTANQRFIKIARNNREISDVAFRLQIISTVTQIEDIYWDLVAAYEDVRVKERSLALANKTLSDNRKQVEIGTLAPIEVVRAQSQVASSNQDLIVSQTTLQLQQLLMKNAITKNMSDPQLALAAVIPSDMMSLPANEPVVPTDELINDALSHRAELAETRIQLVNFDISKKGARNALLPQLDIFAYYGAAGLGGLQNAQCPISSGFCLPVGSIPPTGYTDAFNNLFNSTNPDKGVGITLNIPIRNRSAQADQVRSELEYRQAQVRLQQQQNQIRVEVRNAQFSVQQNRARVDAAIAAVRLANETLDAEQKKYALGASTNFNVLQAQRDVAQAESNEVTSRAAYEKSRVELDRATGLTLNQLGIDIGDAVTGNVTKPPVVPNVVPRPPEQMEPAQQPQANPQPQPAASPAPQNQQSLLQYLKK